jgi:hypothetical protein
MGFSLIYTEGGFSNLFIHFQKTFSMKNYTLTLLFSALSLLATAQAFDDNFFNNFDFSKVTTRLISRLFMATDARAIRRVF